MSRKTSILIALAIGLTSASAFAIEGEETEGMSGMSAEERQTLVAPTPYVKPAAVPRRAALPAAAKRRIDDEPAIKIVGEETDGMSSMSAEQREALSSQLPYGATNAAQTSSTLVLMPAKPLMGGGAGIRIIGEETEGMNAMSAEERQTLTYPTPYIRTAALAREPVQPVPTVKRTMVDAPHASVAWDETAGMDSMSAEDRARLWSPR